jgi:hypothetical protein
MVFNESQTLCANIAYGSQTAMDNTPSEVQLRLQKVETDKAPRSDSWFRVWLRSQTRPTTADRCKRTIISRTSNSRFQDRAIFKQILAKC